MARNFPGGPARIECAVGSCGPVGSGAYTLISLLKLQLFFNASGVVSLRRLGAYARYDLITGNRVYGLNDFSNGFPTIPSDVWYWVVERKVAGSAHYEWALAAYPVVDPNVDIIFGESVNSGNHTDPGIGDAVWLGQTDVDPRGDHALHAMFTSRLSDNDIKSALTTSLSDVMALSPAGCWPLNQASAADPVEDVTGNGADETAVVGTVAVVADPPGYDFSLGVTVTGSGTIDLGGLDLEGEGTRTTFGTATIDLGSLILSGTSITGGPVPMADDFYSAGPCRPYDYVSFCAIPAESAAVSGYALEAASELVYYAGAQRFDTCQVTLRPCRKTCNDSFWPNQFSSWWEYGTWPRPALVNGSWYNIVCGSCGDTCSCTSISEVILPGPVREIVQVVVDGNVLTADVDYRLDDYRKLVRIGDVWPFCNDLNKGITEVGTWSVTATYGLPLPVLGKLAVGELLCEIIADLLGGECNLPPNVTDITRQGVTLTFETAQEALESGFIGLKYVDRFVKTYNPSQLVARPRTYDLDAPDSRVTGTVIS